MEKYIILLDASNYVLDMQIIEGNAPSGYIEISSFQYHSLFYNRKPWTKFNGSEFVNDSKDEENFVKEQNIRNLRNKMKGLQAEINLSETLLEDVTALEAEFTATKTIYDNLVNPPE